MAESVLALEYCAYSEDIARMIDAHVSLYFPPRILLRHAD